MAYIFPDNVLLIKTKSNQVYMDNGDTVEEAINNMQNPTLSYIQELVNQSIDTISVSSTSVNMADNKNLEEEIEPLQISTNCIVENAEKLLKIDENGKVSVTDILAILSKLSLKKPQINKLHYIMKILFCQRYLSKERR